MSLAKIAKTPRKKERALNYQYQNYHLESSTSYLGRLGDLGEKYFFFRRTHLSKMRD